MIEVGDFHGGLAIFMQNGKGLTLLFDRKQDVIEVGDFHAKLQGVNLTS